MDNASLVPGAGFSGIASGTAFATGYNLVAYDILGAAEIFMVTAFRQILPSRKPRAGG